MQQLIDRLKCGQNRNVQLDSTINRLKHNIQLSNCDSDKGSGSADLLVIERLTLYARRLRRLNEAKDEYPLSQFSSHSDPINSVIEHLRRRTVPQMEEADLLSAQTFALPPSKYIETAEEEDEVDYETMRMEAHVHNEWVDKLVNDLKNINFI